MTVHEIITMPPSLGAWQDAVLADVKKHDPRDAEEAVRLAVAATLFAVRVRLPDQLNLNERET